MIKPLARAMNQADISVVQAARSEICSENGGRKLQISN